MTVLWKACEEPERPTDPYVTWCETQCNGCAIKAEVTLNQVDPTTDQTTTRILHNILDLVAPETTP